MNWISKCKNTRLKCLNHDVSVYLIDTIENSFGSVDRLCVMRVDKYLIILASWNNSAYDEATDVYNDLVSKAGEELNLLSIMLHAPVKWNTDSEINTQLKQTILKELDGF